MGIIDSLFQNPRATIMMLLLALPGRMLAISVHESAHGWVAEKCGDPTARQAGRITINPLKHLDPLGILMMLLIGIGWAKPVPVNPMYFRDFRKDDLKVSIAGITANLILFLICALILYSIMGSALAQIPQYRSQLEAHLNGAECYITSYNGQLCYMWSNGNSYYYSPMADILKNAMYYSHELIRPIYGEIAEYLYTMLGYCMVTNIMLAIFNLIPLPPLDGYHVLNDLLLKKPLFASRQASTVAYLVMVALLFTGILSRILEVASGFVFAGVGKVAEAIYSSIGIL